jgi:hypothetical protein
MIFRTVCHATSTEKIRVICSSVQHSSDLDLHDAAELSQMVLDALDGLVRRDGGVGFECSIGREPDRHRSASPHEATVPGTQLSKSSGCSQEVRLRRSGHIERAPGIVEDARDQLLPGERSVDCSVPNGRDTRDAYEVLFFQAVEHQL